MAQLRIQFSSEQNPDNFLAIKFKIDEFQNKLNDLMRRINRKKQEIEEKLMSNFYFAEQVFNQGRGYLQRWYLFICCYPAANFQCSCCILFLNVKKADGAYYVPSS